MKRTMPSNQQPDVQTKQSKPNKVDSPPLSCSPRLHLNQNSVAPDTTSLPATTTASGGFSRFHRQWNAFQPVRARSNNPSSLYLPRPPVIPAMRYNSPPKLIKTPLNLANQRVAPYRITFPPKPTAFTSFSQPRRQYNSIASAIAASDNQSVWYRTRPPQLQVVGKVNSPALWNFPLNLTQEGVSSDNISRLLSTPPTSTFVPEPRQHNSFAPVSSVPDNQSVWYPTRPPQLQVVGKVDSPALSKSSLNLVQEGVSSDSLQLTPVPSTLYSEERLKYDKLAPVVADVDDKSGLHPPNSPVMKDMRLIPNADCKLVVDLETNLFQGLIIRDMDSIFGRQFISACKPIGDVHFFSCRFCPTASSNSHIVYRPDSSGKMKMFQAVNVGHSDECPTLIFADLRAIDANTDPRDNIIF